VKVNLGVITLELVKALTGFGREKCNKILDVIENDPVDV